MTERYGIAEWFGQPFTHLPVDERKTLARAALRQSDPLPCPFQRGTPPCSKRGGVCSLRVGPAPPVITCPNRFKEDDLIPRWLARVVGFTEVHLATEVPFMRSPSTGREAGRIDLVLAKDGMATKWFGLEIQAVYFSGQGMEQDFRLLSEDTSAEPPAPTAVRRPDWRSSSAKRLMPQLQVKAPTLRRWGTKLAVSVDMPFFEAIGGPSPDPSQDLDDGDVVWLIPRISDDNRLVEDHWEVLSLEASSEKLLSADMIKRQEFESALRTKLQRIAAPE